MATLKEVYDAFKADGAPMPDTYEAFESFMTSGPNNGYDHRKEWYDAFKADGAPLPDTYEAFSAALFEPSRQPAAIADDNAGDAPQADQAQSSSPMSLPPTTGDRIRMLHGLNTLMKNGADVRKETVEQTGRVVKRNTPEEREKIQSATMQSRFMGMPTKPLGRPKKDQQTNVPESGAEADSEQSLRSMQSPVPYGMVMDEYGIPIQQWLLPDGTVTTDYERADEAETDARGARLAYEFNTRMRRNGLDPTDPKDVVDQKLEDQTRKARASQKVLHAEEAQKSPYSRQKGESVGQYLLRVLFSGQPNTQTAIVGRSVNGYDQALKSSDMRSIEGTLHTLGKVRDLRESQELERGDGFFDWRNIGNFGTGLKHVATDIDTYAGGTLEAQDMLHLVDIKNRTEQGEQLSDADLAFAEAMMLKGTAEGLGSAPHGYTAGRTTGEMGRFMIQMIMNPTSGAGKRLATALVNRAVRKYGAQGAAKWTAKVLGNVTANKVAGHVAGDVLSSAVLANTLQMPTTLSDAIGRNLGNVTVGADGTSVEFSGGESLLKSIAKAEGAATIENFTEKLGDHFGGIGRFFGRGVTKSAEKLGLGNIVAGISSFATRIKSTEWAKAIASMESRAQWNGTLGEILEEESGIVLNAIFTGDNKLSDLTDLEQQIDIVLGVGLFGGVVSGIKTAGYPIGRYRAKKGVDATNAQANALFGNDWVGIKDQIDGADDTAFTATVTNLIRSVGENYQQAEAITRYAQALMKWRGYNLAQQMQNEEPGAQTSMQSHVENSFERGYNTSTPQEMNDARNAWEYQREQVKSVLSEDEIAGLDSNPVGTMNEMRATGLYDTAQMDAALDYVNAKATYDGMIQSVRDDIDEKIAMSDAMINGRVNQASGMIQPAVMGLDDRQVYVVGGTLAVNDDGTIDRDASDESIVVRDAETGRLEFTDPKSIVSAGNAIDPEMERAVAIDNIRRQTAQTAVDAMNGTLAFNPGDVVPVNDGGGVVDVTIVGPAVDRESGMPVEGQVTVQFPNGQQTTFAKEQLQGFADAANLERFNAFERERSAARARQRAAAEATRPQFAINDEFTILNENGTPVRGSITGELDGDGTVEIYTEERVNGKTVNHVTPAELERMLDTYNGKPVGAAVAVPENAETVPNPAENPETGAETGENPTETVPNSEETVTGPQPSALSRIPVDGQGQRRYEDTDADTAWDAIVEQSAGDEATAAEVVADIVSERRDNLKAAEKVLDKVKEGKPEKRKKGDPAPTMEERIAAKNAAKAALSSAQADYDRAKSVLDHWELIAGTRQRRDDERRRAQEEEQRRLDAIAHDEAVARFEEEQRVKAEKQAEQERIGTHAVNPRIKEKWDGAPKINGNSDAITLPDGSTLTGRYVLTEAGAASASHDVENAYMPTEGFPVDENGQSVNDRDYMRDKDAQRIVEGMADSYDSRALQDPVIVSNDGVVLSGNNRTMSGDLAAGRGTDRAYVDYLAQFGHRKYGFTPEQVNGMKNPRVVFVPDEALPYDAATFARFNAQEKKSQGKPEAAVKLGKIVPDNVFGDIVGAISRYDRLSDYYADEKAVAHALGALMQAGVINDRQMPEMRTGTALSAAGKELIENTLIGKVFQTSPDAVRQIISVPALRQSVVMGLNEIANNRTLARNGYDISGELARAVDLVTQARSAMPHVYTTGVPVSPFGRMQGLFDDEFGDSRVTDGTVLLLADILNSGKPSDLRKVLTAYNNEASQSAGGQMDMFSGTIPTKEEILTTVNDHFRNATPKEQRALVDAAIAERKRRATADAQQRGELQANEQTPNDVERRAEPRQSAAERAERGGVLPVTERGGQGNVPDSQRRQQDNLEEREIDENGHPFVVANDGTTSFGIIREDSGLPSAPIKLSVGYQDENGRGYGLRHIESGHGKEIRNAGFSTVEEFVSYVAKNYDEDNIRVGKRRDNGSTTYLIQVTDSHDNTLFIELSRDGSYWNVNSGGVFRKGYSNKKETVAKTEPQQPNNAVSSDSSLSTDEQSGTSSIEPNGEPTVSDRKVNDSASEKQGVAAESSLNVRVKAAEAEVNTTPTPGQKEAGNYKKGHVQIGTFDVTIEQPVGSVRHGTDANGKEWATTMQNTYGYIRGTEGVDGDHIDVFLSTDIDAWNGRRVVIVDQYNPDGSFDEHKVMLGFNDKSDAVSAYLANYEKGWKKDRRLVFSTAALEDFEKWIESSHRKQKPYHEYKIADKAEIEESTPLEHSLVEFAGKYKNAHSNGVPAIERQLSEWLSQQSAQDLAALDARMLAKVCNAAGLDKGKAWAFRMSIDNAIPKDLVAKVWELRNAKSGQDAEQSQHKTGNENTGGISGIDENGKPIFNVGENAAGDAETYDVAKGLVESVGIEVIEVDNAKAQEKLDNKKTPVAGQPNRANEKLTSGSVLLSISGNSSSNRAASKEYETKLKNKTLSAKNKIAKYKNGDYLVNTESVQTAIKDLGRLLTMDSKGGSRYTVLRTDNGDTVAVRLSDHRANGNNFQRDGADNNLSIVIERKRYDVPGSAIEFTEAVIPLSVFEGRPKDVVSAIVNGVDDVLADKPFSLDSSMGTVEEIRNNGGDARLFHTPSGIVYGWTVGGKIYLNRDAMNPETPLHEYTHLWDDMVRRENLELWNRGKELMKQTPVWDEVMNDPNYADIRDDEDAVASEVHSRLAGAHGTEILGKMIADARKEGPMAVAETVTLVEDIKRWLGDMFKALKKTLGKWGKRDLKELTAEDFVRMTLRDLAEGMNPGQPDRNLVAVHNISEQKLMMALELGGLPMPSIAITRADMGHPKFGEISIVFNKNSIDPTDKRNKVYGGDAWTPIFPPIEYKFNEEKTEGIYARARKAGNLPLFNPVHFHPDNYERRIGGRGRNGLVDAFMNDYDAKQLYLSEKGNAVTKMAEHEVEKYSAQQVTMYEAMVREIGIKRLRNESRDTLEPDVKRVIAEYYDIEAMRPVYLRSLISNSIRRSVDYALNGNVKTEIDIPATQAEIDSRIDSGEYRKWLEEMFDGVVEKSGIRNGRDKFTPTGSMRKWESLYDAVTLDNVVRAMARQSEKGGAGLFGGNLFGAATKGFKSIEDIRNEAELRIKSMPNAAYDAEKEAIEQRLESLSERAGFNGFSEQTDFEENVKDAVAKSDNKTGIYRYLHDIYPELQMETADEIADIVREIQRLSTQYFEAKPQRAVGFNEVRLAVVPEGTSEELIRRLEKMGIPVRTYERGNEHQRQTVISHETADRNLRFHTAIDNRGADADVSTEDAKDMGREDEMILRGDVAERHDMPAGADTAMARGREDFDAMRDRAVAERGIVMPGLNEASVRVVDVPRHDFSGTGKQAIEKARDWSLQHLVGEHWYHEGMSEGFRYRIDEDAIGKYLSSSSTKGSDNLGIHLAALKTLPAIINNSIEAEIHADYAKTGGKRIAENGVKNPELLIHRYYGATIIDGKLYRVKTTIKETSGGDIAPYNYQVTELELLISGSETSDALSNSNRLDVAKLLQGVEKSYDPGKKLLDASENLPLAEVERLHSGLEKLDAEMRKEVEGYLTRHVSAPLEVISADDIGALNLMEDEAAELTDIIRTGEIPAVYFKRGKKIYIFAGVDRGTTSVETLLNHENIHATVDTLADRDKSARAMRDFRESLLAHDTGSQLFARVYSAIQESNPVDMHDEEFFAYTVSWGMAKPTRLNRILSAVSHDTAEYLQTNIINHLYGKEHSSDNNENRTHRVSSLHSAIQSENSGHAGRGRGHGGAEASTDGFGRSTAETGTDLGRDGRRRERESSSRITGKPGNTLDGRADESEDDVLFRHGENADTRVSDMIETLFDQAVSGNLTGKPVKVGRLTNEGREYLEKLSGLKFKKDVSFVLNPSDLAHMYKNHFGNNEKDKGNNIPLTTEDIRAIADVVAHPERVIFGIEPDGLKRNLFYFLSPANEGAYNLLEIYGDRKGNLTAKTFYKTKKGVSQRVLSLMKSEHLTSVTDGATLSVGAKLPNFFETSTLSDAESSEDRMRQGDGYGAYSDAEVSYANDPVSKALGKNRFSGKRQAEFAAQERARMVKRVEELASKLHLDKSRLEIVTDVSQLEGNRAKAKGFYNKSTGKITIVIPNNVSTIDVEQTLLHEAVAHYGLRKLFGKQFDTFLDNVYESADESIRRKIAKMAAQNGWNFRTATEEYLAGLAEDTDFAEAKSYGGWWAKIKSLFLDMLEEIGFEGFRDKAGALLTDNELRYILWRSYENLAEPGLYRSILGEAADVAKQSELKVGNYAEKGIEAEYAAEPNNIDEVNDRFNRELQQQVDGTLRDGHIYQLGSPGNILLSTGVPNLPIQMSAARLHAKATEYGHDFNLEEIRDLVKQLQTPMAIFAYGNKGKMQNIIVGIESNGKQFVVGLSLNPVVNGTALEINSIRNIFPKNNAEWLNWISQGKLLYANKAKIQALIDKQRTILADVDYLDLEDVAKIVENFENPTIGGKEKVQAIIDSLRTNPAESERIGLNLDNGTKIVDSSENSGTAEEENNYLYRSVDNAESAREEYDRRVRVKKVDKSKNKRKRVNRAAQLNEAYLDSMRSLRVLQEAVSHETGEPIEDYENAYMAENHMSSISQTAVEVYKRDYFEPLCGAIADVCGDKEGAYRELLNYIVAKHGLERNEYMRNEAKSFNAQLKADHKNGKRLTEHLRQWNRDFSGLTGLTGESDWQSAETAAQQMVDAYESTHDTGRLWQAVNAATKATLTTRYQGGLLSKDVYNELMTRYKFYVPLKGWEDATAADIYEYVTDARGLESALKGASGRNSLADDPLATIMVDAQRTIMEAQRNLMKQKFLNLALNHQTDLLTVSKQWYEKKNDGTWEVSNPDILPDDDADTIADKIKDHETKMKVLESQKLAKTKRNGLQLKLAKGDAEESQHVVRVKRNGETFLIYVNGDPRAALAINGMLAPKEITNVWSEVKDFMAKTFTTWNPEFIMSNLARDVIFSGVAVAIKEDKEYCKKYTANVWSILRKATLPRLLYKWEHGTLDDSVEIERYFKEFLRNGGETGYTQLNTVDKAKRDMQRFLKEAQGGGAALPRRAWRGFWNGVELMNRAAEDTTRFAVYMTSRQQGRSVSRSIHDAKEITVNFNKKGSGALGARYLKWAYAFFNAAMQAVANAGRLIYHHPGKATAALCTFASAGFLAPFVSCALASLFGDGDDEYWNQPEWVRRNNLMIWIPWTSKFLTIPLPHELRPFYGMGEIAFSVLRGKETADDGAIKAAEGLTGILPVDVTGNGGNIWASLSPTPLQPVVQAKMNVDYFGKPLYRKTAWNENDPEWTKAYPHTNGTLVNLSRMLSESLSTKDEYDVVSYPQHWYTGDINPAVVEHLLESYTGGLGKTVNGMAKTISMLWNEDTRELRNVPVVRKFIQSSDERAEERRFSNDFFKLKKEYDQSKDYLRKLNKLDDGGAFGVADRVNRWLNTDEGKRHVLLDDYFRELRGLERELSKEDNDTNIVRYEHAIDSIRHELVHKADSINSVPANSNS